MAVGQEEIGQRIKQAREEAGLTQPELASRIGVKHPQSISRYERGLTEVKVKRLEKIADVTGKSMTFFVRALPDQGTLRDEDLRPVTAEELRQLRIEVAELRAVVDQMLALLRAQGESPGAPTAPEARRARL